MRRSTGFIITMPEKGMSLIELLATLMILSLVATMTIGVAGPMAAGQRRAAASSAVELAFERARLIAFARTGATLIVRDGQLLIVPAAPIDHSTLQTSPVQLPSNWVAQLQIGGERADELRIDAAGRSVDAIVFVQLQGATTPAATIAILGVTGQTRIVQESAKESTP